MDLYILRHAIAATHSLSISGGDSERPLTTEGADKMRRAAQGMKAAELSFDLILSSPYLRAKQTAEIVANVFGLEDKLEFSTALVADGSPKDLLEELKQKYGKRKSVVLVGHEPYLGQLISLLISGNTNLSIEFKKGALCKLWARELDYGRCATLEWLMTSRQMRRLK